MKHFAWLLVVLACCSLLLFPRALTLLLALAAGPFIPGAPLAVGLLADALYAATGAHALPFFTIIGGALSGLALFVRARFSAGSI
ncbi:MAG: hypothetical protein Q7S95_01270 [bacterium]|nr:hypothetical protein [bacterium]